MIKRISVVAAGCLLLGGCAIRPMPEDMSGVPTTIIVKQIRCETRQAIKDFALDWLTFERNLELGRVDRRSYEIGLQFRQGRPLSQFTPELFQGRVRHVVGIFYETGIAYNFTLGMKEENNLNTEINLLKPFTTSNRTLGISAKADRSRRSERIFTITDSFRSLFRLPEDYCAGEAFGRSYNYVAPPNYIYPITGEIGIKNLIADFINLTLFDGLGGPRDNTGAPPTIADTLEFITTIGGSLTPKVVFSPAGTNLQVVDASLRGDVSRTDNHTITMGLAVAKDAAPQLPAIRSSLLTPLISASPTTPAEAAAAEAVNQAITLRIFRPTLVVGP